MKKILKTLLVSFMAVLCMGVISACGDDSESSISSPDQPQLEQITGVTFTGATYDYDGTEKQILVSGEIPNGVSVEYSANKGTNAGTYTATATLSGEGYETKTLNATLTINKIDYNMSNAAWNYTAPFVFDGLEKEVKVVNLPDGVSVSAYTNNKKTETGTYTATATLAYDTTNYNAPTIGTCTWRIVPNLKQLASNVVESWGNVPDPWEFLPDSFTPENRTLSSVPDYTNFVNVGSIPTNGMGKQLNMVYGELTKMDTALSFVRPIYQAMNTIKSLYTTFLDSTPEDYKKFSGTALGIDFAIELTETQYILSATVRNVDVKIYADLNEKFYGARIQLTSTSVLSYQVKENSMVIATTILDVSALYIEFIRQENVTLGYVYEYLGKEGLFTTETSALIRIDNTYTTLIGTKGDFIPTSVSRNCEVYLNSTGALVGTEVREELTIAGLTATYNTLWYPLKKLQGVTSIKKVDTMNGMNADTIYINGYSEDTLHSKLVANLSKKAPSRRFDIEFKTMYFWQYDEASESYESVTAEIPMLFVQEEQVDTFETDFAKENKLALNNASVSLVVEKADADAVNYGYYTLLSVYDDIQDEVTFADIQAICQITKKEE